MGPAHPGSNWYQIMYGKLPRQIYSDFAETLHNFIRICEAVNIQVLVVLIPDAAQMHEPERQKVNLFVAQTCKEMGVPFVDVTKRFEKEKDPRTLYLFPLDAHTSPKGHRLIADSIFEQIEGLQLLTVTPSNRLTLDVRH